MKRSLVIAVFICAASVAIAQEKGTVTVIKDPLIDSMIRNRGKVLPVAAPVSVPAAKPVGAIVNQLGYRVQIFYGSDRRSVFSEQARFRSIFPKHNAYITFKTPNYYLRVGDFRSRLEAQAFVNELKPLFPSLFIFREKINPPEID